MADEKTNDVVEETTEEKAEETTTPEKEEKKEEAPKEEPKEEAPAEEEKKEVEVPKEFKKIVEDIEKMTVLELNQLVKVFEEKFGVSAAAVAVAGPAAGGEAAEEKDEFDVELTSDGGAKIPVMKAVKALLDLGLKEAKEMVEGAPVVIKTGVKKEDAEEMKAKLEEAGGEVTLK
jgi:large subunit ribosomal protein L7/L12